MPVNCNGILKALTEDLPADANMQIWVGAWRKGVSWNHAKIIVSTKGANKWNYSGSF